MTTHYSFKRFLPFSFIQKNQEQKDLNQSQLDLDNDSKKKRSLRLKNDERWRENRRNL